MALFAFVLSGIIDNGGLKASQPQNTIATVNGTDIDRVAFNREVEIQGARIGAGASQSQIRNFVWEQQVRKAILGSELESLGITAEGNFTRKALTNALRNDPTFFNEAGLFDYAKLEEYVNFQRESPAAYANWLATENQIVSQALETTYFNLVQGGIGSSLADGELEYRLENDKVDIQFVQVPYSSIPDDQATVSEAEIEAYMRAHEEEFTVDPQVDIQYVLFPGTASAADELALTDELNKLINDDINGLGSSSDVPAFVNSNSELPFNPNFAFKKDLPAVVADTLFALETGSIYGPYRDGSFLKATRIMERATMPDSAKARHILIPIGTNPTDNVTRDEAQAKATADSLVSILKADKSRFEEFVTTYTSDTNSIPNGGLYDWFTYNAMVPEFRDFSFESEVGDLDVVKSQFGFHIIEVLGQTDPKPVVKLATLAKEVKPSEKTLSDLFTETTMFQMNAAKGEFSEVAKEATYGVRPVNGIGQLDDNIPGIGSDRSIVNWAFNQENAIGDVNRFDVANGFVVVQLTRRNTEKALMSIAEASATVTPILRNEKKAAIIRGKLTGSTPEEIAQNQSVTVSTANALTMKAPTLAGAGTEPKVVGTAFGLKAGQVSKPIDGINGVYVVRVVAINAAPVLTDYSAFAEQARQRNQGQITQSVYGALKKAADIEDNRAVFY